MAERFVIDGVCHHYNFRRDNEIGRFGRIFNDIVYSFYPVIEQHENPLSSEEWHRNWAEPGSDEFIETMLLESDTDMICAHATPIYDAFKDGYTNIEKAAELKEKYPDRVVWYATADILRGEPALQSLEHQIKELGADGIKLYPHQRYRGRTRFWKMDDHVIAFPVFELAQELGIKNIAVHKALPIGPVEEEPLRVQDIAGAAIAFPDLNFQVIHAGFMFLEDTAWLIGNHPNVYANLEATILMLLYDEQKFAYVLDQLLQNGPDKILYSSTSMLGHPRFPLEAFENFQAPETSVAPVTDEVKDMILAGNFARLHGIDIEAQRRKIADDRFSKEKKEKGLREPWSTMREKSAARV